MNDTTPDASEEQHPESCPYCGLSCIVVIEGQWELTEILNGDKEELYGSMTEYRCTDCETSFWV